MWSLITKIVYWFRKLPHNKRLRVVFYVIQGLTSLVFTSFLYEQLVGPYQIIDLTSFKQIINFILSAQILLCLFLFICVWNLFYNFGYKLIKGCNKWIVKKVIQLFKTWITKKSFNSNSDQEEVSLHEYKILENQGAIRRNPQNPEIIEKGPHHRLIKNSLIKMTKLTDDEERYLFPYLILILLSQYVIIHFNSLSEEVHFVINTVLILLFIVYLISFFLTVFLLEIISELGQSLLAPFKEKK